MPHNHEVPKMVLEIDRKNFDHLVDTAKLILRRPCDNNARELAEIFMVFAEAAVRKST